MSWCEPLAGRTYRLFESLSEPPVRRFRDLGMAAVADDEPPAIPVLAAYQQDGRAWVITDHADRPVAYLPG